MKINHFTSNYNSSNNQKENYYYTLDETNDHLYSLIQGKVATFLSYWYFSTATEREDFEKLNEDIESGNV